MPARIVPAIVIPIGCERDVATTPRDDISAVAVEKYVTPEKSASRSHSPTPIVADRGRSFVYLSPVTSPDAVGHVRNTYDARRDIATSSPVCDPDAGMQNRAQTHTTPRLRAVGRVRDAPPGTHINSATRRVRAAGCGAGGATGLQLSSATHAR